MKRKLKKLGSIGC